VFSPGEIVSGLTEQLSGQLEWNCGRKTVGVSVKSLNEVGREGNDPWLKTFPSCRQSNQ
jgi:hypothetical protein